MSNLSPRRPILGVALFLTALWGASWAISLLDSTRWMWWYFPYVFTVVPACAYAICRGIYFINPDLGNNL